MLLTSICIVGLLLISQWGLGVDSNKCDYSCEKEIKFDATFKGEIKSPGYDCGSYPDNINCHYRITAPEGYRVKLTFKDIDIDPTGGCKHDNLWIAGTKRDNLQKLIVNVCGTDIPYPVISRENENVILLNFVSDHMVSGRGFHVVYESAPGLELCSGEEYRTCRNRNCFHESKLCDGKDDCGDGTDEERCGLPVAHPDDKLCGSTPILPDLMNSPDRQVGGMAAIPHSWPWQVALQPSSLEIYAPFCGGSLISPRYVLTAAHCVSGIEKPSDLRIIIGGHSKYKKSKFQISRIADAIVSYPDKQFKQLNNVDLTNDLTMIRLNAPVQYSDGIQPVCLPYLGWETQPGWECFSTGWGETRGTGFEDQLKQTKQVIQNREKCVFNEITQICVKNPRNSPCHGDSGGPLVCKLGSKWYLMGVASFVRGSNNMGGLCGMDGSTTVFAKVSDKYDWIRRIIGQFG